MVVELDTILTHLERADMIFIHARPYRAVVERDRVYVVVAIGNRALEDCRGGFVRVAHLDAVADAESVLPLSAPRAASSAAAATRERVLAKARVRSWKSRRSLSFSSPSP